MADMIIDIYARVSTQEQANHGLSIDTQLDNLHTWAKENGHTISGEYVDAGISGKKPVNKRPALSRWIQEIEAGRKVDALVFTKLDRFFRSVKLYYQATSVMDSHGIGWQAIQEDYETITSAGRFKVNIMLSVAEAEADRTSERIKVVLDHKAAKGEYTGHKIPIGYSVSDGILTPNNDATAVKSAFATYRRAGSISAAMDELHRLGINYRYPSVRKMLTHRIYTGQYKGNLTYCEPIIPIEEFEEVQAMLKSRSTRRNPSNRIWLFSGIIRCGSCGGPMVGKYVAEQDRFLYRCPQHFNDHTCPNKHHIRESLIEDYLLARITADLEKISTATAPVQERKTDRSAIMQKIDRLKDLYVDGFIDKDTYIKDRAALTTQLTPPKMKSPRKNIVIQGDFGEHYTSLSREDKRSLWRSLIDYIVVDGDDCRVYFLP